MALYGFVAEESVMKKLVDLRNKLISEYEEKLIDEKWKRAEQREEIQALKKRISDIEKRDQQRMAARRIVQRQRRITYRRIYYPPSQVVQIVPGRPNQQQGTPSTRVPVTFVRRSSSDGEQARARNTQTAAVATTETSNDS